MTPQWHQHARTRNPFHRGSRIRMFDKFSIDRLYDSAYEVAEGYLAIMDHGELLFQSFCCRFMVEPIYLRLGRGLSWREQHRSDPVDNYIHDASQRGCIEQRQKHGAQSETRSRWTKKIGGSARARRTGRRESNTSHGCSSSVGGRYVIRSEQRHLTHRILVLLKRTLYESHRFQSSLRTFTGFRKSMNPTIMHTQAITLHPQRLTWRLSGCFGR